LAPCSDNRFSAILPNLFLQQSIAALIALVGGSGFCLPPQGYRHHYR
jgi:hypothetical protein